MEDNSKKVTQHRMSLPPWITSKTSHLQMLLKTKKKKKKNTFNVLQALTIKKLEKQVSKSIEDDLKLYEAKVFETRYFSHIQITFPASAKILPFPPKCIIKKEQLYQNWTVLKCLIISSLAFSTLQTKHTMLTSAEMPSTCSGSTSGM